MGFFEGPIDYFFMRIIDILLAFPSLLLVILIAASLGPGLSSISLALIFSGWAALARIIRSSVLSIKRGRIYSCRNSHWLFEKAIDIQTHIAKCHAINYCSFYDENRNDDSG